MRWMEACYGGTDVMESVEVLELTYTSIYI
jgi:hypothetical protein